jgi:hypothetical protein
MYFFKHIFQLGWFLIDIFIYYFNLEIKAFETFKLHLIRKVNFKSTKKLKLLSN